MEQNKAQMIVNKLLHTRFFPKSAFAKVVLGIWWIIEPILIELPIANFLLTKYEWEILGPINIALFLSTLFAVVYGALCLGAGYIQWSNEKFAKKPL